MLESTPVELAVTAYLLRAYGFRNNVVYELLSDNSFDVGIYEPAIGSTGGTGDKNLNKQLFIPKARDRKGGSRGAPAWLPVGERLGDWLSQQIGFADEAVMEDYTVFQVGGLNFSPAATMGGMVSGVAQRNLTKAHWNWTGSNAATAVNGDTGSTAVHEMVDAINEIRNTGSFNLGSLVGAAPAPSAPAAPPAPAVPAAPAPPMPTMPAAPAAPAKPVAPPAPTIPSTMRSPEGTTPGDSWLRPVAVSQLPDPRKATRTLNTGSWRARQDNNGADLFTNAGVTSTQKFYPAVGPVYISMTSKYLGLDVGPNSDLTIREYTSPSASDDNSYFHQVIPSPNYTMVIGLEVGKQPCYYLIDETGAATMPLSLVGFKGKEKLQVTTTLEVEWSDPTTATGPATSIPTRVRFSVSKPGSKGGTASKIDFEIGQTNPGLPNYSFQTNTNNPLFATTTTELFNAINASHTPILNGDESDIASNRESVLHLATMEKTLMDEYDNNISTMAPSDMNPLIARGTLADILARQGTATQDTGLLIYGIAESGLAGPGSFNVNPTNGAFRYETVETAQVLGQSLVMPNRVGIHTTVDQYIGSTDEYDFLAREELDWETSTNVEVVYDKNDPKLSKNILSMQLLFQDADDTITEYSGITPDQPDAPRMQRIYIPGDVPSRLTPIGIPLGSELQKIEGYPRASAVLQRMRLTFVDTTGTTQTREFPDSSNRVALQYDSMVGGQNVMGKAVAQELNGASGYIVVQLRPDIFQSAEEFIQVKSAERQMTRTSNLNQTLPTGSIPGVRQVIWRDGGSINILVPDPEDESKMILLNMVLEENLE